MADDIRVTVRCARCGATLAVVPVQTTDKTCIIKIQPCAGCLLREAENRMVAYHRTIAGMLEDRVVVKKRRAGW